MRIDRRSFLKSSGLGMLPVCLPSVVAEMAVRSTDKALPVNFIRDGLGLSMTETLDKLQEINRKKPIVPDFYGNDGTMEELLQLFQRLTGKEKAVYMPSGTMANQLAIRVLSGDNTKVFVQETSHVYRDEADAATALHGKRLIPLAPGEAYFTLEALQQSIAYHEEGELFKSGIGVVSIENPVRRCMGKTVPVAELQRISGWCREKGYKLHLDGARLHLAAAFAGVSVKEYAGYFDTVFISLYKCVGAINGAVLCGDKAVMDKMEHQIKIHGGALYRNWHNSALALYYLEGLEERLRETAVRARELMGRLNQLKGLTLTPFEHGSNCVEIVYGAGIDPVKLSNYLREKHQIVMRRSAEKGKSSLNFNETLLNRPVGEIVAAYREALSRKEIL
nr:beta-eliminating lyase-related protein [uncultured Chitinophaga sp.]